MDIIIIANIVKNMDSKIYLDNNKSFINPIIGDRTIQQNNSFANTCLIIDKFCKQNNLFLSIRVLQLSSNPFLY
jgi:hypothetical protein